MAVLPTDVRRSRLKSFAVTLVTLLLLGSAFAAVETTVRWFRPDDCAAIRGDGQQAERLAALLKPCLGPVDQLVRSVILQHGSPDELRIAVIGESSAGLLGAQLATTAAAAPVCDRPIEVMDCGQWRASIEHVRRRLDEVLAYSPNVVVLVFGHNTRFRLPMQRTSLWARAVADRSCVLGLALSRGETLPTEPIVSIDERLPDFEALLDYAAEATAAHGAKLIVTTMASNEWLLPNNPFGAVDEPLARARALAAAGRRDEAIDTLRVASGRPDTSAALFFQLGAWLAERGDATDARQALQQAVDLDPSGFRAHSRVNDTIRRVAERRDIILRDTEAALAERAGAVPGWETFRDNCHLDSLAVSEEADAILSLARSAVGLPPLDVACRQRDRLASLRGIVDSVAPTGGGRWAWSLPYATQQWLAADPEGAARDLTTFLASPELAAVGPNARAEIMVGIADGFARADRGRKRWISRRGRRAYRGHPA